MVRFSPGKLSPGHQASVVRSHPGAPIGRPTAPQCLKSWHENMGGGVPGSLLCSSELGDEKIHDRGDDGPTLSVSLMTIADRLIE